MKILKTMTFREKQAACRAFTMVEIALCLAIIGFALVAIIGVLPTGLSVQRNNREETIISQDATYFMDAIRSGARGLDDLTNYVYAITNASTPCNPNGVPDNSKTEIRAYTYEGSWIYNGGWSQGPPEWAITNGHHIIGLLAVPKYTEMSPGFGPSLNTTSQRVGFGPFYSNYVSAYIRAISGNATEKAPQKNPEIRDIGFSYKLLSEIVPYAAYDTNWIYFNPNDTSITAPTPQERDAIIAARSNNWLVAKNVHTNLYDVRLRFLWPLLPNGSYGNGRQTYRSMVSGYLTNDPAGQPFFHFESRAFARDPRTQPWL
jgi:type II secretory pathway pseudopilin PulG